MNRTSEERIRIRRRAQRSRDGHFQYSEHIAGDTGNYRWKVKFDLTRGYLGINQTDETDRVTDRVLLSPMQIEALLKFLEGNK